MKAQNIFLDENTGGKGRYFKARILQPGLVKYSFGVCLLEKETIDKFVNDFVGCPVIIGHQDVTNQNADKLSRGNICHVWYDDKDGWYWVDGIIDNQEALNKIDEGYSVSCQYEITEYSNNTDNKLHNGNPYDKVILNGKPEHLAIVETPRYESAMIAVNALEVAMNEDKKEDIEWITVKGNHIPVKKGQSKEEAVADFIESKHKSESKQDDKHESFRKSLSRTFSDYGNIERKKELTKRAEEYRKNNQSEIADLIQEQIKLNDKNHQSTKDFINKKISYEEWEKSDREAEKRTDEINEQIKKLKDSKNPGKQKNKTQDFYEKEYQEALKEISEGRDYAQINFNTDISSMKMALAHLKRYTDWDEYDVYENIKEYEDLSDDWNKEQIGRIAREKAAQETLKKWIKEGKDRKNEYYKIYEPHKAKNSIIQAINELKDTDMFKSLFRKKEQEMNKDEMKQIFAECLQEVLIARNEEDEEKEKAAENEDEELEEELKVEEKAKNKKCKNEDVDKREIIRQIMAIAGKKEASEDVKTIAKLAEKLAYDKSEAGTADNGKKAKCEDEEEDKEEAKNKAKNAIDDLKGLFASAGVAKASSKYVTQSDAIDLGNQLF